jgi:hypothetical protein
MPSTEREIVGTTLLSQKSQPPRILTPGFIKAAGCIGLVANALVPPVQGLGAGSAQKDAG